MMMSGAVSPSPSPFSGSLLCPVTLNDVSPENPAPALTTPTCTSLWLGGHSEQPVRGRPVIAGDAISILIVTDAELPRPEPFMAEHVNVVPAVLEVRFAAPQPVDELIPDSGSTTLQLMV